MVQTRQKSIVTIIAVLLSTIPVDLAGSEAVQLVFRSVTNDSKPDTTEIGKIREPTISEIKTLVNQLRFQRNELHKNLELSGTRNPSPIVDAAPASLYFNRFRHRIEDAEQRMQDLRLKIDQQLRTLEAKIQNDADRESNKHPPEQGHAGTEVDQQDTLVEPPTQSEDAPVPDEALTPVPIVPNAVDRLQLADSLYATQDYSTAFEIYREEEKRKTDDYLHAWINFQMAACLRHLDQLPQAEKYYRIVAGLSDASQLPQYSRWWLDAIATIRQLRNEQTTLSAALVSSDRTVR